MNMNIYLNDNIYHKLERYLKNNHISRSKLISQALDAYLSKGQLNDWPKDFFKFDNSYKDIFPDVKKLREGLTEPKDLL